MTKQKYENETHRKMEEILQKNGELFGKAFDNIFSNDELEFSQQLILSFNTFAAGIEAFADSIQNSGVQGWNFEKMLIGIKRSNQIHNEEQIKK